MPVLNPSEPNPRLRYEYDRGTGYETELRLPQALSALTPADDLVHTDQRMFQIVHLITEYAWAAIHHTLCDVVSALEQDHLITAARLIRRCTGLAALPVSCLRLLIDSLPQSSFLRMRAEFSGNASGLDSPGGRGVRKAAHVVWDSFESAVAAHGLSIAALAAAEEPENALLSDLALELHRFDSRTMEWKQVHLNLVWQLLGGHPGSTGAAEQRPTSMRGRPITDLERLAVQPLFPRLWQESTALYRSFGAQHAY